MRLRFLAIACLATLSLHAAEDAASRGKRVVYDALKALGGDAFLSMKDRVETGRAYSFFRSELSGLSVAKIYTRYLPAPGPGGLAAQERESFGKKEEDGAVLLTGEGAWEISFRGARPVEAERLQNYKDSTLRNIFYILLRRLNEPGLSFYSQGSDILQNQPVEIVDITDSEGRTVTVYFGKSDGLPVRQVYKRRNPTYKDFDTEVTIYSKYRDVGGGVKWPLDLRRERNGEKIFEMYSDSVEINQNLPDSLFGLPAGIKMVPNK
jgi:hypothetical protein